MEKFITHEGTAVPLMRSNVNTDDIIPARFLKSVSRTGFGRNMFANWRYLEDGSTPDPDFELNRPGYEDASILISGENFGCGSSREHAPWALREYGFVCIIAPSFADIFHNNCFNSDILPVTLDSADVEALLASLTETGTSTLRVDLPAQSVTAPDGKVFRFEIDAFRKNAMTEGLDNIGWSLSHKDEILAYEERRKQEAPWLFT
ncbi:3-isopropylmalate dehydratase small subunit [Streptomyces sp. TR06-5]|uniref:3-isopropylmalate dehydratase small subunit n=1 Tax=unclassified Streptomyces TaxID=2593676 RepID=UPI0039A11018